MRRLTLVMVAVSALLHGCATRLQAPELEPTITPINWQSAPAKTETTSEAAGHVDWWREFGDQALDKLVARGLAANLDVKQAMLRVKQARLDTATVRASSLPNIGAGVSTGSTRTESGATERASSLRVEASWEIDLFGRVGIEADAAQAAALAVESDAEATRQAVVAEIARSYLEYRLYSAQVGIADSTVVSQSETLRVTRARYEQGMASRLELERASGLLATTRASTPLSRALANAAKLRLARLTAVTWHAMDDLLDNGAAPALGQIPDGGALRVLRSPVQVIEGRPDLQAARQRLLATTHTRSAAQLLRYPRLDLGAMLGLGSSSGGDASGTSRGIWSIGAGLVAPLFDFGRIDTVISRSDIAQQQALVAYESSVRAALEEAQSAIVRYAEDQLRQRELGNAATAARTAAGLARQQFAQGTLSQLEVMDAERSLYAAELAWFQASADVGMRLIAIYLSSGAAARSAPSAT